MLSVLTTMVGIIVRKIPEFTAERSNSFKHWWVGKCIAIIGPTASGKNSLFNKLRGLEAPTTHVRTRGAEKIETFEFHWPLPNKEQVKFRCKRSINVGGETDERDRFWLDSCSGSDVIFYLVDIQKLIDHNQSTMDRIKSDLKWISANINHFKANSSIHVLLNKIDKLSISPDPVDSLFEIEANTNLR